MARLARVVVPGLPHHVTQRGNRRQPVFFEDGDYSYYLKLVADAAQASGTEIWAYCLMPNHVHFIMVPSESDGLRKTLAEAHRRYTSILNKRHGWTGHLWQGRFYSVVMDERHLSAAIRYVAMNPVEAGLVKRAEDWPWSSARTHILGRNDGVVQVAPVIQRTGPFEVWLNRAIDLAALETLIRNQSTGRPAGDQSWIDNLAQTTGLDLAPRAPGPKRWNS